MREIPASVRLLLDIEARQDDALRELEALERRLDEVLAACAPVGTFVPPTDQQAWPAPLAELPAPVAVPMGAPSVAPVQVA